jgi:GGDEF domain-containing protein
VATKKTPQAKEKELQAIRNEVEKLVQDRTLKLTKIVEELEKELSERRRNETTLRSLTVYDELTTAYNRRGFLTFAEHHLKLARRAGIELVILLVNMQGDKPKDDSLKGSQWNQALVKTIESLRMSMRPAAK